MEKVENVLATAPVLAQDRGVRVGEHLVQQIHREYEIVDVPQRANEPLGHDVEREEVIRQAAAEHHLVLRAHAAVVDEPPQQHEHVRRERMG